MSSKVDPAMFTDPVTRHIDMGAWFDAEVAAHTPEPYDPTVAFEGPRVEYFQFFYLQFNVTKARQLVAGREPTSKMPVADFYQTWLRNGAIGVDIERAMRAFINLQDPIIVGQLPGPQYFVLDGNHRLLRAYREGVEALPLHLLTIKETEQVALDPAQFRRVVRNMQASNRKKKEVARG